MRNQQPWTGERMETFVQNEATAEHLHRYGIMLQLVAGKTVLDIACGEGFGASLLAASATAVTGIDIDAATIQKAALKYKNPVLTFREGSLEAIPCPAGSFDIVTCFESLEHVNDHEKVILELKRVLKENGLLVISTPDKKYYSDKTGYSNPFHLHELYEAELEKLLAPHFSNCRILHQCFCSGSLLINKQARNNPDFYTGDFNSISITEKPEHTYLLAFCSNNEIPDINTSFFEQGINIQHLLAEKEKEVTGTLSYRLGHFILYPFKLIRRIFRK